MNLKALALLSLAGFSLSGAAHAAITNGGFSSGLTGWTTTGDVSVQSGAAFLTTASTAFDDDAPSLAGAFNSSGNAAVDTTGVLDAFSGLGVGALDPDPSSLIFAFEGSALKQTFSVNAGDTLSFDWQLVTNDPAADYAYVVINGAKTNLALASIASTASTPFAFESAASLFSQTFATAQSVTLGLGVVDVNDFSGTTALRLDNVTLTPIPEPSTAAFGLLAAAAMVRRRRARQG